MLKLVNIKKEYITGDSKVEALKGIDLCFRKNEFVSILGPSGCGKTTMLNIIGGLDKYTSGDLQINGKSTKQYKDRDWDIYRNHRIGFIFQSYNLIPHQTILGNVELALQIAGISKEERITMAKNAIDKVGLKGLYNKKPNQLSGGQCQRVAIARALVNEPEILLADEPTGALDTQTSIQIMELIKEISKDKLVIMVTHNPELAEQYSTRIIKLLDGLVVDDSNPYTDEKEEVNDEIKNEKAKMSFLTSFRLSLKNLLSKKGRTLLTSIAGSIGIVGVSTVLAISSGVTGFINNMQDDMLSGNPITITEETFDLNAMMDASSTMDKVEIIKEEGYVNVDSLIESFVKRSTTLESLTIHNNITQDYIDYVKSMPSEYYSAITLGYRLDVINNFYTDFKVSSNSETNNLSVSAIRNIYTSVLGETDYAQYASYITSLSTLFDQCIDNPDYILSQYNILNGRIATQEDEIMVVLDSKSAVTDLVLAQLGYYTQDEFLNLAYRAANDDKYVESLDKERFKYDEILNKTFTYYPNNSVYNKIVLENGVTKFTYNAYNDGSLANGKKLKIVGIIEPKEDISYGCLKNGFYYTKAFTDKFLNDGMNSEIANYMRENNLKEITSGKYTDPNSGTSVDIGITYKYNYTYNGVEHNDVTGYVGSISPYSGFLSSIMGGGSNSNYSTLSLNNVGGVDVANEIYIYPVNFELKNKVTNYLDAWNNDGDISVNGNVISKENREKITYTDTLSLVIAMIKTMINIITYALVSFTALSLLVSCVMIGIITYVSVVERTKEIGVIRSLGGRKKDVSNLFNAETFIIGLTSGVIGIAFTYFLSAIINAIIYGLAGVKNIAALPLKSAIIMIIISILLTLISGLIPARSAAKRDPVVALRTE